MQFSSKKCKLVIMNKNGSFRSHQTYANLCVNVCKLVKALIYAYADSACLQVEVKDGAYLC